MSLDQLDLFSQPPAQRHSATSRAAAEAMKPHLSDLQSRVLAFIARCGPVSDQTISVTLGLSENTVRPRRRELQIAGLIHEYPLLTTTVSGRKAVQWVTNDHGERVDPS